MFIRIAAAGLISTGLTVSVAHAHRASVNRDICMLGIGQDAMQVTAYQPQDGDAKLCRDVPEVGPAIIVLDYVDSELRGMTTDIRIVRVSDDLGGASELTQMLNDAKVAPEALDPVTEKHIQAQRYPSGTINFEHVFTSPGKYHGIVTVKNTHGQTYVSDFPLSVGRAREGALWGYGSAVTAVVAGVFIYCMHARGRRTGPSGKPT